jgi:hypothetical protein
MYAILIILMVITLLEIYTLIPEKENTRLDENYNVNENYDASIDEVNGVKFNEYRVNTDVNVLHYPGKILIKENYNVILKYKDESILMEKDIIYNIKDKFEIEIINIDNNYIYYYYTRS